MVFQTKLQVSTLGRGFYRLDNEIQAFVHSTKLAMGMCHVFVPHTSASIIISENADPDVLKDLEAYFTRLAPDGDPLYLHTAEGADDMPAHVRTVLTQSTISIPICDQALALGVWQGIFLWEHRHKPHRREIIVTIIS